MINVLDSQLRTALAEQDNQEDQLAVILAAFNLQGVTVKVFAGNTLLSTVVQNPFYMTNTLPRRILLGSRISRTFYQNGTPTKVVFSNGVVDLFEMQAGVGSGAVMFTNSVNQLAVEKMQDVFVEADATLPVTPVLNLVASSPNRVVVESWATGSAVDVGIIVLDTMIRADRFSDSSLATDCRGWIEYGPSSTDNLPVLDGVQFSAKGFDIKAGGVYGQRSYRVMVMMRAIGPNTSGVPLVDGLFGDVRGVNHYPGPHKLRILSVSGAVLKTIEMRDGLPVNDVSLPVMDFEWTVNSRPSVTELPPPAPSVTDNYNKRVSTNKNYRPHMAAGSSYVAYFGDEPESSTSTRSRIPRVKESIRPVKQTKVRSIFGGGDVTAWGGNGFFHPDVVPKWGWSQNEIDTGVNVAPGDPDVFNAASYNWEAALRNGWGHEPGSHGGIVRRSGPGGVRPDRTSLPSEFYQMGLTMTTRPGDGSLTSEIARSHAKNQANYPGYYPKSMLTLDPIDTFSSSPQPTIPGREITPVMHYYGGNWTGADKEVWIGDTYGDGLPGQIVEWMMPGIGLNRTNSGHVRNGWCPDGEHNVRIGNVWAALLYSDPVFSRLAEHLMLESSIFNPVVARGTWQIYSTNPAGLIENPGTFWHQRSNIIPFAVAAAMWWVATNNGTYTRASIENRMHTFFAQWKQDVIDALPSTANAITPSQKAYAMTGGLKVFWQTWGSDGNIHPAGSGWVAETALPFMYIGQFLILAKTSGLLPVLKQNPTSALVIESLEKQLEFQAKMLVYRPWSVVTANGGFPHVILKTASQGAVSNDLTTLPSDIDSVLQVNASPLRSDGNWFLSTGSIAGTSEIPLNGNYSVYGRMQTAWFWWKYFAEVNQERTDALVSIEQQVASFKNYVPVKYDSGFARINFIQDIPALEI